MKKKNTRQNLSAIENICDNKVGIVFLYFVLGFIIFAEIYATIYFSQDKNLRIPKVFVCRIAVFGKFSACTQ